METPLKQNISSVEDFLKRKETEEQGQILTLPSGLHIKIKIPGMEELIMTGAMTEELMDVAMRQGEVATKTEQLSPEEKKKQNDMFLKLCDNLVIASAVMPRVTEGQTDIASGTVSINDIVLKDRMRIAMTVMNGMNGSEEGDEDRFRKRKSRKVPKK